VGGDGEARGVEEEGGMGEARAAAPAPGPWQPAGVRRTPQAPCPLPVSLFRKKKKGGAGGEGEARGRYGAWIATSCSSHHVAVREGGAGRRSAGGRPWRSRGRRAAGQPRRRRPAGEAAGRGNARAGAAEPEQVKSPLHRAEPPASSSPSCSPPRRDAKARGCCTRETSM
jgi:hypothetical protein